MKLVAKLSLVFLAAVMLLTGVSSYLTVRRTFERFEQQQRERARQIAARVEEGDHLAPRYDEEVLRALQRGEIADARWVLFERQAVSTYQPATPLERLPVIRHREIVTAITIDGRGVRHLHTYCPLLNAGTNRGGLEFTESLAEIDAQTRETIATALLSIGAMAIMAVMLALVVGVRWVARPLDRLIKKTERIGRGDFSQPLPVTGKDELSQLTASINSMCVQLADQQETIRAESQERIAALGQLRHADRLKTVGRLAAGIAHELGTPLNVVSGRAGLIAAGKLSADEVRTSAEAIKVESDRITAIVRQLLDFARCSAPRPTDVDLETIIGDTLRLLGTLADKQGVQIVFETPTAPHRVCVDPGQMQQVLTNLVMNAVHSMPAGGQVTVRLATSRGRAPQAADGESIFETVTVEDQGVGIDDEHQGQIFEPFFTTKDIGEGTGLGLSIAYGIVQEHGGWIDVQSEKGCGSRFTVFLPQPTADNTTDVRPAAEHEA